jgi:hypothetical protein
MRRGKPLIYRLRQYRLNPFSIVVYCCIFTTNSALRNIGELDFSVYSRSYLPYDLTCTASKLESAYVYLDACDNSGQSV